MWKATEKTTTIRLFLDSLSPKYMRDVSSGDKLKIALFGDLSSEEAMDLSPDRKILELEVISSTDVHTPYIQKIDNKKPCVTTFSMSFLYQRTRFGQKRLISYFVRVMEKGEKTVAQCYLTMTFPSVLVTTLFQHCISLDTFQM
jgi:hypothetical protein